MSTLNISHSSSRPLGPKNPFVGYSVLDGREASGLDSTLQAARDELFDDAFISAGYVKADDDTRVVRVTNKDNKLIIYSYDGTEDQLTDNNNPAPDEGAVGRSLASMRADYSSHRRDDATFPSTNGVGTQHWVRRYYASEATMNGKTKRTIIRGNSTNAFPGSVLAHKPTTAHPNPCSAWCTGYNYYDNTRPDDYERSTRHPETCREPARWVKRLITQSNV